MTKKYTAKILSNTSTKIRRPFRLIAAPTNYTVSPSKSSSGMHQLSLTKWNNFDAKNIEQVQRCSDNFYAVLVGEIRIRHRLCVCTSLLL